MAWIGSTVLTFTLDDRLLAGPELRPRVVRWRDDDDVVLPVGESRLGGRLVGTHRAGCAARRRRVPGSRDVGRQAGVGRDDDDRLERSPDAVVAEPEDGHDQERPEDEADQRARPAEDLDDLLADEREEPEQIA